MFDYLPRTDGLCPVGPDTPHRPLAVFVAGHIDGLLNAAALLGGLRGRRLVQSIHEGVLSANPIHRRTHRALQELLENLTLEHVGDPDRDEAAFFAAIDPADPCVADLCLLTDQYRAALASSGLDRPAVLGRKVA